MVTYTHNTARHSTTEETPYMMMFGRDAPDFSPEVHEIQDIAMTKADYADRFRDALIEPHRCVRKAMKKAQRRYKRYYDKPVVRKSYEKGDLLYLWQPTVPRKGSRKLTPPWRGPYRVKEKINELNVILGIVTAEGESTIRVHINRLRKTDERVLEVSPIEANPLHQNLPEGYYIVEKLVGERVINGVTHFRVRWRGYSAKQDTWEPETNLPPLIVNDYREMIRAKRALRDVES